MNAATEQLLQLQQDRLQLHELLRETARKTHKIKDLAAKNLKYATNAAFRKLVSERSWLKYHSKKMDELDAT